MDDLPIALVDEEDMTSAAADNGGKAAADNRNGSDLSVATAASSPPQQQPLPTNTRRLVFRWWQPSEADAQLAFELWGDPSVNRYLGGVTPDRETTAARLVHEMEMARRFGVQYWPVFYTDGCEQQQNQKHRLDDQSNSKDADDDDDDAAQCNDGTASSFQEHVGAVGLAPKGFAVQRRYELGFHLRPKYVGRGLAKEAATAAIHFAFDRLQALSVFARHFPQNAAAARTLLSLGFVATHGDVCYALTREAWEKRKHSAEVAADSETVATIHVKR